MQTARLFFCAYTQSLWYTMPASSSPISILLTRSSTEGDSVSASALRVTPALSRMVSAREPHGAMATQNPTLMPGLEDLDKLLILVMLPANRDAAFTMISPLFLPNSVVFTVRPESDTAFIVFSLADTKTSAGEPFTICAANVAEEP